MKILVDEMPFWETDCPFFEPGSRECSLSHLHCRYMDHIAGHRIPEECDYLEESAPVDAPKATWKYYKKQGIAVCTNCSFERKLDDDFGKATSCPNCNARMAN